MEIVYDSLSKIPNVNAYLKQDLPIGLNYKNNVRVGEIVLIADIGHSIYLKTQDIDWSVTSRNTTFTI